MKRLALLSVVASLVACWLLVAGAPPAKEENKAPAGNQVELNGHTFTLPAGFDIELAAGPPLADRPITADFDEQGRLYIAEANGAVTKEDVAQKKPMHRIVRLEDTDGDGKFDKRVVFADQMLFPEGTMWYAGSLYVAAPPSIWKLTDTDGDGVADQRSEWFQGKTLTGCANDLHGPYLGPDGWIYWAKGAFAKQTYQLPDGKPFTTRASHLFRCRPDGSGIEPVMTGGMDNPVDVAFTPGGERIFTTTFFQHPAGGHRDGLIHAVYGGIYGKDHDVIYDPDHKWTSPALMPVLVHLGAAAPCGLTRYESKVFGPEYQDNLFACCFNMHKVTRHVLEPEGATFKCRDEDFLVSNNLDFHPTDVLEDADGSLLVVDTGGWYKLCCPTSQLHKPDVLGGIYRVRKKGAPKVDDPRGLKIDWTKPTSIVTRSKLAALLGDSRPAVRKRAIEEFARWGSDTVAAVNGILNGDKSAEARKNAVWTDCRIDDHRARYATLIALGDPDETVRQAAIHSVSIWRDRNAVKLLTVLLKNSSQQNRRAAAEALGRLGDKTAVPALLEALGTPADRELEHSLTYALIEIADAEGTAAGLKSGNLLTRRAALTALDQMAGGKLDAATVAADLTSADARLKETAWWIASRHPEWGTELAGFLRERLTAKDLTAAQREELAGPLARFARTAAVQDFLAERLRDAAAPRDSRRVALRAMAQAGLKETPEAWTAAVTQVLDGDDAELVREAVSTARTWPAPKQRPEKLAAALLGIGGDEKVPAAVRLNALAAVPGGLAKVDPSLFAFLRAQLDPEQPVPTRLAAADVLAKAKLTSEQLSALTESVRAAGPLELDRLLEAYASASDEVVGRALVAALKASSARASLRIETLKPRLAKFGPSVQKDAAELYAALDAEAAEQRAKLEGMLASMKDGDVRRGQAVFNGTKAACATCHAIGYLGGKVGPDLTHIGKIRSERDLLESIVFPSLSFVRSYEPLQVTMKSGKVHNGVLRKDAPDEIVLALNATEEVRLARDDIEDVQPGKVSIMPAGLDQQLTPRDLADLVAFLKACQ